MTGVRMNTLTIRTPEGVVFSFVLAGPVVRFLAWQIDLACIFVVSSVTTWLALFLAFASPDIALALWLLSSFAISVGYSIALEWLWRGQTIGKRLLRLRVMDEQGLRLQFSQIVIRNLLRFADILPAFYLVGGIACLVSRRAQRLGDFAANTIVVRNPRTREPDLAQISAVKFNSFLAQPHLAARLRQSISPQEAGVALQALLRRDSLDPAARLGLFAELAAHFRQLVVFPQEATDGLSDEQYVRNVVDVVFRSGSARED